MVLASSARAAATASAWVAGPTRSLIRFRRPSLQASARLTVAVTYLEHVGHISGAARTLSQQPAQRAGW